MIRSSSCSPSASLRDQPKVSSACAFQSMIAPAGVDGDVGLAGRLDDQARLLLALAQRQLRLLLGRDVDHEAAVQGRLAALVGDHDPLVANPDLAPVARVHAVLADAPAAELATPVEVLVLQDALSVVGMDVRHPQLRVGPPLLGGVAEQVMDARADVVPGRLGPEVGHVQHRRQLLDHRPIALLGLLQVAASGRDEARPRPRRRGRPRRWRTARPPGTEPGARAGTVASTARRPRPPPAAAG